MSDSGVEINSYTLSPPAIIHTDPETYKYTGLPPALIVRLLHQTHVAALESFHNFSLLAHFNVLFWNGK